MFKEYIPYIKQIIWDKFQTYSTVNEAEARQLFSSIYIDMPTVLRTMYSMSTFISHCMNNKAELLNENSLLS
jgi:hypothetical protein